MRRHLVFLHYDPEGHVDTAVLHTLRGFRPHVEKIFVVVNGFLDDESRGRLDSVADEVMERENVGFDIGAYRAALGRIGYSELSQYDELLLVNYTFFGPVGSFGDLFERMDASSVDFWGMTDHIAVTPHPILGVGTMPQHLQSYWLAIRNRMFMAPEFREYWSGLKNANSYHDVIVKFETEFTQHFADRGFTWEAAYSHERYGTLNASMEAPLALLDDGCPMFKRRIYFHDAVDRDHSGVAAAEVTRRALELGYPRAELIDGIYRRTPSRQLSTAMDAYLMMSEPSTESPASDESRVNVFEGDFWKSWLGESQDVFGESGVVFRIGGDFNTETASATMRAARERALNVTLRQSDEVLAAIDRDEQLGFVVPLVEHRSTDVLGNGYGKHVFQIGELTDLLGIRAPLEPDAPLTPVFGISVLREEAFADLPARIAAAGGWGSVAASVGGEGALSEMLDLLAADIARTSGFITAQAATPFQMRVSHAMLEQKFSRVASRFGPGPKSPFGGAIRANTPRAVVARWVKNRSPEAAARIAALERTAKGAAKGSLSSLRQVAKRVVGR